MKSCRNEAAEDDEQDSGSTLDSVALILLSLSCCLLFLAFSRVTFVSSWIASVHGFANWSKVRFPGACVRRVGLFGSPLLQGYL